MYTFGYTEARILLPLGRGSSNTAQHSETKEPLVIYKRVKLTENTPNTVWARPLKMFNGEVNIDGKLCPRFDWLPDEFNTIKCPICLAKELKKYCEEHDLIFE